jgi:hypothetical protein
MLASSLDGSPKASASNATGSSLPSATVTATATVQHADGGEVVPVPPSIYDMLALILAASAAQGGLLYNEIVGGARERTRALNTCVR